jgi:hypothetical protein
VKRASAGKARASHLCFYPLCFFFAFSLKLLPISATEIKHASFEACGSSVSFLRSTIMFVPLCAGRWMTS